MDLLERAIRILAVHAGVADKRLDFGNRESVRIRPERRCAPMAAGGGPEFLGRLGHADAMAAGVRLTTRGYFPNHRRRALHETS